MALKTKFGSTSYPTFSTASPTTNYNLYHILGSVDNVSNNLIATVTFEAKYIVLWNEPTLLSA
jgi:hypothetical protein